MKKKQALPTGWKLVAILFSLITAAPAFDGIYVNNPDGVSVTITDHPDEVIGAVTIPASIDGKTVTAIGNNAFDDCIAMTGISIPATVTSIGTRAFSGCSALLGVSIPGTVTSIGGFAFFDCNLISTVTLANGISVIGDQAFMNCDALTSITIPASVSSIGILPFKSCNSLVTITVSVSNPAYSSASGMLLDKIGSKLIQCPAGKFGTVSIPSGVITIVENAFAECALLTGITIPLGVTFIENSAFTECTGLTSITLPVGLKTIGGSAFYLCTGISTIMIPSSVTSIGNWAFLGCFKLTSANFRGNAPSMGTQVFDSTGLGFTISYYTNRTGYSNPTWNGYPSIGLAPTFYILSFSPSLNGSISGGGEYPIGATANITASPVTGYVFKGWTGAASGTVNPLNIVMNADKTIGATFEEDTSDPFVSWLTVNGFPANSAPNSDPNGDGVNLLMAYALGLDPKQNLSGSIPKPVITANQMSLTFPATAAGVTYVVQTSTNLSIWGTEGVTLSALSGGVRTATVQRIGPARFLRLVVSY